MPAVPGDHLRGTQSLSSVRAGPVKDLAARCAREHCNHDRALHHWHDGACKVLGCDCMTFAETKWGDKCR